MMSFFKKFIKATVNQALFGLAYKVVKPIAREGLQEVGTLVSDITGATAAQKKAEDLQNQAIAEQNRRDANAKAEAEKIGPAARKFDEIPLDGEDELKRRQRMLQNGILGTIKSQPGLVSQAPATEIKKATLGA